MKSSSPEDLELPSDATAPGIARRHSAKVLGGWRLSGLLDTVQLVTSELVTNAVRHGRNPIRIGLRRQDRDVRIEVSDGEPEMGPAAVLGDDSESGRGCLIVDLMASESGVETVPGDGKIAWAVVSDDTPRTEG
jgi:anti-sigma regulatory factor (Ser/Thr protein kinase)